MVGIERSEVQKKRHNLVSSCSLDLDTALYTRLCNTCHPRALFYHGH
jgi:hypothetical protein